MCQFKRHKRFIELCHVCTYPGATNICKIPDAALSNNHSLESKRFKPFPKQTFFVYFKRFKLTSNLYIQLRTIYGYES